MFYEIELLYAIRFHILLNTLAAERNQKQNYDEFLPHEYKTKNTFVY